jgi:hypothetical protein
MQRATPGEYRALLVATLVLVVVLVSSFMCIQLYHLHKPGPEACANGAPAGGGAKEGFLGELYYSPSCGSEWLGRRRTECRGITSGVMPSIEMDTFGGGLCCAQRSRLAGDYGGIFDVPP